MDQDFFINQLNEITSVYENISRSAKYSDLSDQPAQVLSNIISQSKAAVARIAGVNSEYYKDVVKILDANTDHYRLLSYKTQNVIGVVYALKNDLSKGYLKSLHDIVQSEVFSEYIDMADHLALQKYKDPAAVLAGSTLETHLKELAKSNSIDIIVNDKPKKAATLNDELAKASVYTTAYQKQITAWLAIRNDAAHGNYDNYTIEQVKLMIDGIWQFMLR